MFPRFPLTRVAEGTQEFLFHWEASIRYRKVDKLDKIVTSLGILNELFRSNSYGIVPVKLISLLVAVGPEPQYRVSAPKAFLVLISAESSSTLLFPQLSLDIHNFSQEHVNYCQHPLLNLCITSKKASLKQDP